MVYTEDESLCHSFLQCVNMKLKDEWIARKRDKAKFKNIEDKKVQIIENFNYSTFFFTLFRTTFQHHK